MMEEKQQLFDACVVDLSAKITSVKDAIKSQQESSKGETKSSAGDKYETGTAMTHLELEKLGNQLSVLETSLSKLKSFQDVKSTRIVQAGSLVKTKNNMFWISIGIGQVRLRDQNYYVISPLSPIGQQLISKEIGHSFIFNKKEECILEIL